MNKLLKVTLALAVILLFLTVSAAYSQVYTGSVSVESLEAEPGDKISLELRIQNNNVNIAGLFVPMQFSSSDLILDSVSFAGSILTEHFNAVVSTQPGNVVWVSYIPVISGSSIVPIVAIDGLLATLHFSVSDLALENDIMVDSINDVYEISPGHYAQTNIQISGSDGINTYYPDFTKGIVSIKFSTAISDNNLNGLPDKFELAQNYPNPFNPSTIINFALPTAGSVKLEVFNVLGQHVKTLVNNSLEAGYHSVEFDASDQASGIFFYRLTHKDGVETKKMVLVK